MNMTTIAIMVMTIKNDIRLLHLPIPLYGDHFF